MTLLLASLLSENGRSLLKHTPKKVSIPWYRKLLAVFEFLPFLPLELILILTLTRKRRKSKKRIETGVSRTALGVSAMRWSLHQFGIVNDPYSSLALPFSFRLVAHSIYLQLVAFGAPVSYLFRSTIGTLYSRTIFFDSVVERLLYVNPVLSSPKLCRLTSCTFKN